MLNRQKVLLNLIGQAGRPVSGTELTKWSFLIRHESESAGGNAFYDFVPYKLGPFSFALYQELDKLHTQNYISQHGEHTWSIGEVASPALSDAVLGRDIGKVIRQFAVSR